MMYRNRLNNSCGSALVRPSLIVLMMFLLLATMCAMMAHADELALPPGVVKPAFFDKQGIQVLAYKKGVSGLNVWQVQKGSTKTVFYTSADNKVLMSGVLWDASSGANLSDSYISAEMVASTAQEHVAASDAYSPDRPSKAITDISHLTGIKEGRGAIDKTLYIIFDPRCPHCDAVYKNTRSFVKHGGSIKWIPSTVLGDTNAGARLVAQILEAKDPVIALSVTMGKKFGGVPTPKASTLAAIQANEAYFFRAFERNSGAGPAGVPVAFFEKQNGEPQMVASIDDDVLLPRILHDIKH